MKTTNLLQLAFMLAILSDAPAFADVAGPFDSFSPYPSRSPSRFVDKSKSEREAMAAAEEAEDRRITGKLLKDATNVAVLFVLAAAVTGISLSKRRKHRQSVEES